MTWLMHGLTMIWWLLLVLLSAWTLAHGLAWSHRGFAPGKLYRQLLAETSRLNCGEPRADDVTGMDASLIYLQPLPSDSPLKPILDAAQRGAATDDLELAIDQLVRPLSHRLFDSLGLMTRAAPLAGLALTLIGVDQSMTAYAANPADVVGMISGIGTALRSTLIGMGVSVIAMALDMVQRRRVESLHAAITTLMFSLRPMPAAAVTMIQDEQRASRAISTRLPSRKPLRVRRGPASKPRARSGVIPVARQ